MKSRVAYLTKKTKLRLVLHFSLLRGSRPKSPGSAADNVLRLLQISLNQFTSGGVIAECVNTIKTRHKVNPILGEAIASRRVTIDEHDNAWLLENGDCWLVKKTIKDRIHTETNKMQANITASRLF